MIDSQAVKLARSLAPIGDAVSPVLRTGFSPQGTGEPFRGSLVKILVMLALKVKVFVFTNLLTVSKDI